MEKAPERIWLQWNPENDSDYTWTGEGVTWCDEQIHASDIEYVRANAQPDAPEAMTMPDDVRAAIRQALEFCAGDYCMTGDRYDHFEVALAWLDAQPEAPEPDWTNAPEWAQWWAVDANGMAWWYATQPEYLSGDGTEWDCGQQARRVGEIDLPLGTDWRTTLRRRPEAQP